jgi:hypothetical protein
MYIITKKSDNSFVFAGDTLPTEPSGDAYNIMTLPEGESFNHSYVYTPVDGIAIRGDLIPIDEVELARFEAEMAAIQYQDDRRLIYPAVEEQLDLLYHAIDTGTLNKTSEFYTKLKKVKDDNPKPT